MGLPIEVNLEIDRGDDFSHLFTIATEEGPVDLTGYGIKGEIREAEDPTSPLIASLGFTRDDTAGAFRATLPRAITRTMASAGFYDIHLTDTDGNRSRWFKGRAVVSPTTTQE